MIDLRPVGFVIGVLVSVLGLAMVLPMALDFTLANGNARAFGEAALLTLTVGLMVSLACAGSGGAMTVRQAFLMTFLIWVVLPLFAALPLMMGAPGARFTDAYFEAVSGMTTTGSTVLVGLDRLPAGVNLWRGMLNWFGGIGIAFLTLIFLPHMRVGGMQFFRVQGFDTLGKTLPRAVDIARGLLAVYVVLTVACFLTFLRLGMAPLDAVVHAMASIATGGFSPRDASFSAYQGLPEYAGAVFMLLGSAPYIRFMQLAAGSSRPLLGDVQLRAYLVWVAVATLAVTLHQIVQAHVPAEAAFRHAFFNVVSVFSGTGFFSTDVTAWGTFGIMVLAVVGMIGGCTSSSSGALSVFRVQLSFAALRVRIRQLHAPSRVVAVRYAGLPVGQDVIDAIILHITGYILLVGLFSVLLSLDGIDIESAFFAIWTSIGNIGFGIGRELAPSGTMRDFPDFSKWVMIVAMVLGRLGLLAGLVLILPRFWRV